MKKLIKILLSSVLLTTSSFAYADLNVLNLSYRTGPFAITGIPLMDGMLDYSTLLNERDGGIGGEKYNMIECETGYSTAKGIECYSKLKGDNLLTVHPWSTGITNQVIPLANVDNIPVFSMAYGLSAAADGNTFPWIFNFPATYWDGASIMLKYIGGYDMSGLNGKKIVLLHLDHPYGKEPIPFFKKLSKSEIKKMRDKFDKTGKLPPHLMKLAKLMDKHTEVRNIVVPGLEWMSKLGEGKLTEDYKNSEWEVYLRDEKGNEKIVKKAKSKRAATILYNRIIKSDDYYEVGMRAIKEGKLKENRKEIAQTILQQLGGNKFIAMTGAKNLGFDSKGSKTTLSFKIGRNSRSINYVKVDYISGKDLYDMSFFRLRAGQLKLIKKVSSIYGDQLQKFFTKNTGLYTRL